MTPSQWQTKVDKLRTCIEARRLELAIDNAVAAYLDFFLQHGAVVDVEIHRQGGKEAGGKAH